MVTFGGSFSSVSDLGLLERFLNTLEIDEVADAAGTPEQLAAWIKAEGLGEVEVAAEGHARALALREALRGLAVANNGGPLYPVDLATLNRAATETGLRPRFLRGGARLEPTASGLDAVLGRLVAEAYEAMLDGSWSRFKACADQGCRWAFVDESRNGKRTWCSMRSCGNRAKVHRFRERARVSRTPGT